MTGADLLVRELQARGVGFVSVLCGHGLEPFFSAAASAGLTIVDTRNEQAASYIADAYARLTRRIGVCAVSSGVAHVHAFAGLANALFDGAPVLLVTGAASSRDLGRGAFQDFDQVGIAKPLCKYAEMVTRPERVPYAVHEAVGAATSGRPGPVHLTVTLDALTGKVDQNIFKTPISTRGEVVNVAAAAEESAQDAAKAIAEADHPLIIAGTGAFYARAGDALMDFARTARIPVVTPIWDRGVVPEQGEVFLGVIGAASGGPRLLEDADLVLLAGARIDYRLKYLDSPPLKDDARIIRIDADPEELHQGMEADIAILGDPKTVLGQLAEEWRRAGHKGKDGWLDEANERRDRFYSQWSQAPAQGEDQITGAHVVHALKQVITDDTVFLVDGGNIGQWAHMVLCGERYPENWITCGASALVGWGIGGAMGARLAFPDKPVLLLSGDGAIGFGLMELESASRQDIPFVVVLADDRAWGIVVSGQQKSRGLTIASELSDTDYVRVAEGLGARGVRAESADQIVSAVREGLDSGKPTLIHVPIRLGGPSD